MAGQITALRYQKRTAERVNVYLDGRFALGLPAVEAARLHVGQYLSDADIAHLQAADAEQKAYDRAVRFLSYRPRSLAEVHRHLVEAGVEEAEIQATIERLIRQGYLDDAQFARFWVENRQQFRPKGALALRQELRQKGLDSATIEAAIAGLDPLAEAVAAGRARALRLAALAEDDPAAFRRKLGDFLLRRGFDFETVREAVRQLAGEVRSDEELSSDPLSGSLSEDT